MKDDKNCIHRGNLVKKQMSIQQTSNAELATMLNCTKRSITDYRKGHVPCSKFFDKLILFLKEDRAEYFQLLPEYRPTCNSKRPVVPHCLLGYDWDNGVLKINPKEADIVRDIFRQINIGVKRAQVANWLNAQGIKGKRGGRFAVMSLTIIIKNPIYIGKKMLDGKLVDGNSPAIISEEVFWEANKQLKNGLLYEENQSSHDWI